MTHIMFSILVFTANWGFAVWGLVIFAIGWGMGMFTWWWYGKQEGPAECTRESGHSGPCNGFPRLDETLDSLGVPKPQRAETSVQRETAEFPQNRPWQKNYGGEIPYEELEGMFLDQFLLRWFSKLMPTAMLVSNGSVSLWTREDTEKFDPALPWHSFVDGFPWLKEMPLLFEQLTGYKLNDLQLNNAIAEYVRRLNVPRPVAPVQGETNKAPDYTGI